MLPSVFSTIYFVKKVTRKNRREENAKRLKRKRERFLERKKEKWKEPPRVRFTVT